MSKELLWPALMMLASGVNICGSIAAIAVGADKTTEGKTNPFFYTAGATSCLYFIANAYQVKNILYPEKETKFQDMVTNPRVDIQIQR